MKKSILKGAMLSLWLPAFLAGCGDGSEDVAPTTLAREVTNIQCEAPRTTLAQVDQQLADANVQVYSKGCAWDGTVGLAVCGAPSWYLRFIEVPKYQESLVRALGYRAPNEFWRFIPADCPPL